MYFASRRRSLSTLMQGGTNFRSRDPRAKEVETERGSGEKISLCFGIKLRLKRDQIGLTYNNGKG